MPLGCSPHEALPCASPRTSKRPPPAVSRVEDLDYPLGVDGHQLWPHLLSRTQNQSESRLAGQPVGGRATGERAHMARHLHALRPGYFDDETCRLEPIGNPFGPKVLTPAVLHSPDDLGPPPAAPQRPHPSHPEDAPLHRDQLRREAGLLLREALSPHLAARMAGPAARTRPPAPSIARGTRPSGRRHSQDSRGGGPCRVKTCFKLHD